MDLKSKIKTPKRFSYRFTIEPGSRVEYITLISSPIFRIQIYLIHPRRNSYACFPLYKSPVQCVFKSAHFQLRRQLTLQSRPHSSAVDFLSCVYIVRRGVLRGGRLQLRRPLSTWLRRPSFFFHNSLYSYPALSHLSSHYLR